jgi:citrate lyase subunit beta/citryl-CoA lyase
LAKSESGNDRKLVKRAQDTREFDIHALRSWLFVEGANEQALHDAGHSAGDVLIQELEDFTPPALRAHARTLSADVVARWRAAGKVTAVRVNPLAGDGLTDLQGVMPARADIILLPKAETAGQIEQLDFEITRHERVLGIAEGHTALVPNVETALGLVNTLAIVQASSRVIGCLVVSEDMAADLGAERAPDAFELDYVRARFHLECTAAGILSIDCPYTYSDARGCEADALKARRFGYRAKSTVIIEHAAIINQVLTPTANAVRRAQVIVSGFEAARERGEGRVEIDGSLVEWPSYLNAMRLLERARVLTSPIRRDP